MLLLLPRIHSMLLFLSRMHCRTVNTDLKKTFSRQPRTAKVHFKRLLGRLAVEKADLVIMQLKTVENFTLEIHADYSFSNLVLNNNIYMNINNYNNQHYGGYTIYCTVMGELTSQYGQLSICRDF